MYKKSHMQKYNYVILTRSARIILFQFYLFSVTVPTSKRFYFKIEQCCNDFTERPKKTFKNMNVHKKRQIEDMC